MYHYIKKNFFVGIGFFLFFTSSYCMHYMDLPIIMNMDLDLQSTGRLACICKSLQLYSFDKIYKSFLTTSACCHDLAQDFDRCDRGLLYFGEKENRDLCEFLWKFHEQQRKDEISRFTEYDLKNCQIDAYIFIYVKDYSKIQLAKERKRQEMINEKKQKKKELAKIMDKEVKKNIRKQRVELDILKCRLNNGVANLLELQNKNNDIAALFPHKNNKELLYLCCKNAGNGNELVVVAKTYIDQYPAETMDYLFTLNKFYVMRDLVIRGPFSINAQSTSGKTLMHHLNYKCGCECNLLFSGRCSDPQDIFDSLIKYGADVNIVDNKGMTVLHYACKYLHVKTVKKLLSIKGIDVEKKDNKNKRPINYIGYLGNSHDNNIRNDRKLVKLLLQSHNPERS